MKNFHPLFLFTAFVLLVGLACSAASSDSPSQPQPQPQQPATQSPPQQPEAPAPTEIPPTEALDAQPFFTEEFDVNDNWTYFVVDGGSSSITEEDNPGMQLYTEDSLLTFDLNDNNLWVYVTYDPYEYENVRLDARVINRGVNNNNVSLICRYTEDGWYEFNVANNGLYWIFAAEVDSNGDVGYTEIYSGGSTKIKSGRETNEYTVICDGRTLALYINGTETRTVTESKFVFTSGQVGVSVSSFDTLPVVVDVDWVTISEP
jgi:hypothetical protein